MDSDNTQHIRLSDQISNLNGSLIVVYGSNNSNFNSGLVITYHLNCWEILVKWVKSCKKRTFSKCLFKTCYDLEFF